MIGDKELENEGAAEKVVSKVKEVAEDYKTKVIPQISADEIEDFDYIFFYNKDLFEKLFEEYQNYKQE